MSTRKGRITDCDVELAGHVFVELGIADFEPVETKFADLLPGISDDWWRMTTGMFATDERRTRAQFSRPIWVLPDGLLIAQSNPLGLNGYRSIAEKPRIRLAVIRDQFQHRTAVEFGVWEVQIKILQTYDEAAKAVWDGQVDACASVAMAHSGFIELNEAWLLEVVLLPAAEKPPASGSFAFALCETEFLRDVDAILDAYLGSKAHRDMTASFGFSDHEVDRVAIVGS